MFVSRRCLLFSSTLKGFSFSPFIVFVTKRFVRRGLEYCVVERSPLLQTAPQGQGQGREQGQGHCYVRGLLGTKCHVMFPYTAEIQTINYNPACNCRLMLTKFVHKNYYYFIEYMPIKLLQFQSWTFYLGILCWNKPSLSYKQQLYAGATCMRIKYTCNKRTKLKLSYNQCHQNKR